MRTLEIEDEVRSFVTTNFLFGQEMELLPEESLLGMGVIDSTGVLELITFLEERYIITVEDHELVPANLDSLRSIGMFVTGKLSTGA
jgi:acyl carrier protein